MKTRPSLIRSVPYWILIVASVASLGYGVLVSLEKIQQMTTTLEDGTATGIDVYAGQAWGVFAAAFIAAGVLGLFTALAIAAVAGLVRRPEPAVVVEAVEVDDEPEIEIEVDAAPETSAFESAPVAEPASESAPATPTDR